MLSGMYSKEEAGARGDDASECGATRTASWTLSAFSSVERMMDRGTRRSGVGDWTLSVSRECQLTVLSRVERFVSGEMQLHQQSRVTSHQSAVMSLGLDGTARR